MKRFLLAVACFTFIFNLTACSSSQNNPVPSTLAQQTTDFTAHANDIEFAVTINQDKYTIGEKINITVKATNISTKTIYTVGAGHSVNGLGVWLGSTEYGFRFCDNYKNIGSNAGMYYGELNPGETITQERTFDTSDISYNGENWEIELIEKLPQITINIGLAHSKSPQSSDWAESYTCSIPIILESKSIDSKLAQKLAEYPANLITKILLTEDTDEIAVRIGFRNIGAAQRYIDDNFKERMNKVMHEPNDNNSTVTVKLSRLELIQMAETDFNTDVSLY
jgi:maltose-binding protein MalE